MQYGELLEKTIKDYEHIEYTDIILLIQKSFSISKERFWIEKRKQIEDKSGLKQFEIYMERLSEGEPVQYILGESEFFSLMFAVGKGVLIPRPETELLVEKALTLCKKNTIILDIGAGSGAISVALAKNSKSKIFSLEKSDKAIPYLKKNIEKHRLKGKIDIIESDLFPPFDMSFNIIVSNPPYISEKEWGLLDDKIRNYEPKLALLGGKTGSEIIDKIVSEAPKYLKNKGHLLIEIGYEQADEVKKFFSDNNFKNIRTVRDYNGIERIIIGQI